MTGQKICDKMEHKFKSCESKSDGLLTSKVNGPEFRTVYFRSNRELSTAEALIKDFNGIKIDVM